MAGEINFDNSRRFRPLSAEEINKLLESISGFRGLEPQKLVPDLSPDPLSLFAKFRPLTPDELSELLISFSKYGKAEELPKIHPDIRQPLYTLGGKDYQTFEQYLDALRESLRSSDSVNTSRLAQDDTLSGREINYPKKLEENNKYDKSKIPDKYPLD